MLVNNNMYFRMQDHESFGRDWQGNQGYIEIMCRRLRDSAGLHDETVQGRAGG